MSNAVLFFSGEAMNPQSILTAFPGSRFVARVQLDAAEPEISPFFGRSIVDRGEVGAVWGIAIEVENGPAGELRDAVRDDGRALKVQIAETPLVGGDPDAALDAALYWELPPFYIQILRQAAGVAEPEAEGGWETMDLNTENSKEAAGEI